MSLAVAFLYGEMATFVWERGTYNVQGSFNRWLRTNVTANGWPSWGTFGINFDYPDVPLEFPSIAITHLGEFDGQRFQGDRVRGAATGSYRYAMADISCWASGQANNPWVQQLRQMGDMVNYIAHSARSIPLLNIYGSTANPTAIGIIRLGPGEDVVSQVEAPMEPSPNVHRTRHLVRYYYLRTIP